MLKIWIEANTGVLTKLCGHSNNDNELFLAIFGSLENCPKSKLNGGEKFPPKSNVGGGGPNWVVR